MVRDTTNFTSTKVTLRSELTLHIVPASSLDLGVFI